MARQPRRVKTPTSVGEMRPGDTAMIPHPADGHDGFWIRAQKTGVCNGSSLMRPLAVEAVLKVVGDDTPIKDYAAHSTAPANNDATDPLLNRSGR